jgi:hypothetical protein
MDEELALDLVRELRSEYEENAVIGREIQGETVQNRHQDSFEIRANRIPIPYDWVTGDDLPEISKVNLPSVVSGFHQAERWFLIDQLYEADNVPTVSIPEITHNNLVKPLSEVYDPTHLYVPQSEPFLGVQSRQAINSVTDSFDSLEEVGLNTDNREDVDACYAIRGDYIRLDQCTRLPLDQAEWLPDRTATPTNEQIPEHPLYCAYGMSEDIEAEYLLAVASILSKNPTIRDNAAVRIELGDDA